VCVCVCVGVGVGVGVCITSTFQAVDASVPNTILSNRSVCFQRLQCSTKNNDHICKLSQYLLFVYSKEI